ncbi:MAG: TMEM165/GDT1 family protein [Alphaproteobacteria bacterium]|nr:TMEM165/GDT1 family protein [Alphaproteobacteria bacterium]
MIFEPFFVSSFMVALAELGDKTQLLSLCLICKFKKPLPIILGIFASTVINHAGAAYFGELITQTIGPDALRWILGISFIAMAGWVLIPDKADDIDVKERGVSGLGIFLTTFAAFFMAEMGDKTQLATVALAAKYQAFVMVVIGSTLGMMLANVPVVYFGQKVIKKLPLPVIHRIVAVLFVIIGILVLVGDAIRL